MNIWNQLYYLILHIQLQPKLLLVIAEISPRLGRQNPAVFSTCIKNISSQILALIFYIINDMIYLLFYVFLEVIFKKLDYIMEEFRNHYFISFFNIFNFIFFTEITAKILGIFKYLWIVWEYIIYFLIISFDIFTNLLLISFSSSLFFKVLE